MKDAPQETEIRSNNLQVETILNMAAVGKKRITQHDKILNLLRAYNGNWCPLPRILDLHIAQYGRVINDLRTGKHDGKCYQIENKLIEIVNGEKHTAFRLIMEEKQGELAGIR